MTEKRHIAILGSTGSIGTQALDVIGRHRNLFDIELLTANNNSALLIKQAQEFRPNNVVICNRALYKEVKEALDPLDIKVFAGIDSATELAAAEEVDITLAAMVGFSGLPPTINAIKHGKVIALANKETLVAAGSIISKLSVKYEAPIIPVDSEHSAIFQCLQGEQTKIEKLLLTASGGPFRDTEASEFEKITPRQALLNPNWNMGAKVTVDSATMMNKGLETIEAAWLFNMPIDKIEVVVHPQSVIHSMVQFCDGSLKAQMATPDMRLPIQYALSYPERISLNTKRLDLTSLKELTFFAPDENKFPCPALAREAFKKGGNIPCAISGANEVAVASFLREEIKFTQIPKVVEHIMTRCDFIASPSLDDIYYTDNQAKMMALEYIKSSLN